MKPTTIQNTATFPRSYCLYMLRCYGMLFTGTALASLIGFALTILMFYCLEQRPTWEFVVLALLASILCDVARVKAVAHYRSWRLWKNYLQDSMLASPCSPLAPQTH